MVKILPSGLTLEINGEKSLLELLCKNKVEISHICGGFASCGTCRVHVESNLADLPPREGLELEMAQDRAFQATERLACQLCPFNGLVVSIPKNKKGRNK